MHRLRGGKLPYARFSLGKWGTLINILALVYILPIVTFSFFPGAPNPVPSTMNWGILMVGGPVVLASAYYFLGGRRTYTPPYETVDDYIGRYEATTVSEREISSGAAEKTPDETVAEQSVDAAEKRGEWIEVTLGRKHSFGQLPRAEDIILS
jgi:hypothetical protein